MLSSLGAFFFGKSDLARGAEAWVFVLGLGDGLVLGSQKLPPRRGVQP